MSTDPHAPPAQTSSAWRKLRLGAWSVYFAGKLILYAFGAIGFHALENLALALFVALPLRRGPIRRLRDTLAWPLAAGVLYHDAWLPPLERLLDRADHVDRFTPAFVLEFAARFADPRVLILLAVLWTVHRLLARRSRIPDVAVLTALALLTAQELAGRIPEPFLRAGITPTQAREGEAAVHLPPDPESLDARLAAFHEREASRRIMLRPPPEGARPFDVLLLHVCSLSWDDLRFAGLEGHPVWRRFDLLFRRFNSAASYSTPAAVRLLRATCGQPPHVRLDQPADPDCLLFEQLRHLGFDAALALNHDGHFDRFAERVAANGLAASALPPDGVRQWLEAFDGSPVFDDGEVLERWWSRRLASPARRVAAYYNTITLHDGNRPLEGTGRLRTSRSTYRARLQGLLDRIDAFLEALEAAGRPVVVVLVPEHGANMRGERSQVPGLREIPTPGVTRVPVGVALIGAESTEATPVEITVPSSYLALAALLDRILADDLFGRGHYDPRALAAGLPSTPFVAENAGIVVLRDTGRYYLRFPQEPWVAYPPARLEWPRWALATERPTP